MNKKENKVVYIVLSIFFVVFLIEGIVQKDYKLLMKLVFAILILVIMFAIAAICYLAFELDFKLVIREFNKLKSKEQKTVYEELFVLSYQNKLDDLLLLKLKETKLESISNIRTVNQSKNAIAIHYNTGSCPIKLEITREDIKYDIDLPTKYDGLKKTKEFERKTSTNVKTDSFIDIDVFLDSLILLMENIKIDIDNFKDENKVDEFFNGRLISKLKQSTRYLLAEGLIGFIGGSIIFGFLLFTFLYLPSEPTIKETINKNIIPFIILILIEILMLGITIYGANYLIKYIRMKKDISNKRINVMKEKPYRVRIIYDQPSKHSKTKKLRYIKLYFKSKSLLIPFAHPEYFTKTKNLKLTKDKLLEINNDLTYLEKSRLVVKGSSKYINTVKKYLL